MRRVMSIVAALLLGACATDPGGYGYSPNRAIGAATGAGALGGLCSFLGSGGGRIAAIFGCGIVGAIVGEGVGATMDRVNVLSRERPPAHQPSPAPRQQGYYFGDGCRRYQHNAGALATCRRAQEERQQTRQRRLQQEAYDLGYYGLW